MEPQIRIISWGEFLPLVQLLKQPKVRASVYFGAEHVSGYPVGVSEVHWKGGRSGCAWLESVVVDPDYRGQGIATALVRHMVEYSKAEGFERARANCLLTSLGVFERCGFRRIRKGKNGYRVELVW